MSPEPSRPEGDVGPVRTVDVSRPSRAHVLAQRLEREIQEASLPPGARLGTKEELRGRFGVGFNTVNEAIRLMEVRGLVSARPGPGGGLFVADAAARGESWAGERGTESALESAPAGTDGDPSRVSRAHTVAQTIEREIERQGLVPGVRLGTKQDLRARFGIGFGTVNEAVRLMEVRGIVSARPGRGGGLFVADPARAGDLTDLGQTVDWSAATLSDCSELRAALEPAICRQACEHRTSADVEDLRSLIVAMEESALSGGRQDLSAHWALHRRIAAIGSNAALRTTYLNLMDILEQRLEAAGISPAGTERIAVHRRLVDAIATGDFDEVDRAVVEHAVSAFRRARGAIPELR